MEKVVHSEKFKEFAQTLASGSPVILLRHAESKHNEASRNLKARECTLEERANERASVKHRDGPITKLGKNQCKEASNVTNELNVEVVLISPMRRTLQTAYHVFKKHPNFNIRSLIVNKNWWIRTF